MDLSSITLVVGYFLLWMQYPCSGGISYYGYCILAVGYFLSWIHYPCSGVFVIMDTVPLQWGISYYGYTVPLQWGISYYGHSTLAVGLYHYKYFCLLHIINIYIMIWYIYIYIYIYIIRAIISALIRELFPIHIL